MDLYNKLEDAVRSQDIVKQVNHHPGRSATRCRA
ncbi:MULTISPECIES: hypothetical protein [Saliphagus]|uniref:Uncharacterized protein n=1 Tax=Saliphagus infecundisoli TaxID=1849069 RepID=A0ABD5Q977_9EURY